MNLLAVGTLASFAAAPVYVKVSDPTPVVIVTLPVSDVLPSYSFEADKPTVLALIVTGALARFNVGKT